MSNYLEEKIHTAIELSPTSTGYSLTINDELSRLLQHTGHWIEMLAGQEDADQTMDTLYRSAGHDCPDDWRDKTNFPVTSMPISSTLERLKTYGAEGSLKKAYDCISVEQCAQIEADLTAISHLIALTPDNWLQTQAGKQKKPTTSPAILLVYARARARYRLDTEKHLTLDDIALLCNLSPKSVLNATQAKRFGESRLLRGDDNLVRNKDAKEWLKDRNSFKPTKLEHHIQEVSGAVDDFVFIPCAADGTWFLPHNSRLYTGPGTGDGTYIVYNEVSDEKEYYGDYFSALQALTTMKRPTWQYYDDKRKEKFASATSSSWERRERQLLHEEDQKVKKEIQKFSTESAEELFQKI